MNKRDTDKIKKIGPNVERLWFILMNTHNRLSAHTIQLKSDSKPNDSRLNH